MKTGLIVAAACVLGLAMGVVIRPAHRAKLEPAPVSPAAGAAMDSAGAQESSAVAGDEHEEPPLEDAHELEAPEPPAFHPIPPRDPEVRAKLTEKYNSSSADEMRAAYDSLAEVIDAQLHQRIQDKGRAMDRAQLKALEDELGWLAERVRR